jgi:hypothetical protein
MRFLRSFHIFPALLPCTFITALYLFLHSPPQRNWIANVALAAVAACVHFKQGIFVDVRLGKCGFALGQFRRERGFMLTVENPSR